MCVSTLERPGRGITHEAQRESPSLLRLAAIRDQVRARVNTMAGWQTVLPGWAWRRSHVTRPQALRPLCIFCVSPLAPRVEPDSPASVRRDLPTQPECIGRTWKARSASHIPQGTKKAWATTVQTRTLYHPPTFKTSPVPTTSGLLYLKPGFTGPTKPSPSLLHRNGDQPAQISLVAELKQQP